MYFECHHFDVSLNPATGHVHDSVIRREVNSSRFSFSWDAFPSKPQNGILAASSVFKMP